MTSSIKANSCIDLEVSRSIKSHPISLLRGNADPVYWVDLGSCKMELILTDAPWNSLREREISMSPSHAPTYVVARPQGHMDVRWVDLGFQKLKVYDFRN